MGKFNLLFNDMVVIIKVLTPRIGIVEINPETMILLLISFGVKPCLKRTVILSITVFNLCFNYL